MMKGRKVKHNEEALKPKAKGKFSGRISRVKKGVQDRKEQKAIAAIAAMDRDRDTQLLENAREVDVAVPPEVDGRGILEGAKTDELGIKGGEAEEGSWWTNVVDDHEVAWGWGSDWLPCWDLEFSAEPCSSLVAEVVWDDHLWNFDVDTRDTHPR